MTPGGSSSRMPSCEYAGLPLEGPSGCGGTQPSRTTAVGGRTVVRTTQFANQLLTKMHGRIRIDVDGYGHELANAQ